MNPIVLIDATASLTPTLDRPRPDRLVAGNPLRQTWLLHEAGPVSAGVWACEVGRWRIVFPATRQEYFHVLAGRVRLHGPGGATDIGPGQGGVIRRALRASSRCWSRCASSSCWSTRPPDRPRGHRACRPWGPTRRPPWPTI